MTIQLSTLSNGLTVVTDRNDKIESAALGMWIGVGSRHESQEINGISHMLEHMAFRGTTTQSALEIAEKIEEVGGYLNAYTTRECTAYYARVLHQNIPLAVSLLTDILQFSVFQEEELERERAVILQEINQIQDAPDDVVFENFQEVAYPSQSYGRPVAGRAEVVARLSRQDVKQYMSDNYTVGNMVFAATGKVDHDYLVNLMESKFVLNSSKSKIIEQAAHYRGGDVRTAKELEQVHLVLGFEGVHLQSREYYTSSILSMILGGGMSSRLFQEVREKRGLAYGIHSFSTSASDTGIFGVYTSTSAPQASQIIPVVCDVLMGVATTLTEQEVNRAKNQLKASLLMSLESTSTRCQQLALQMMIYGRPLSASEITDRIDAVEEKDLIQLATRLFTSAPTLSAIGPIDQVMSYDHLCQHLNYKKETLPDKISA